MLMTIKRKIPEKVKKPLKKYRYRFILKRNYRYDMKKYLKYSYEFGKLKSKRHYQADLIFYYHKIEKGLSLPRPRIGFGKKAVDELIKKIKNYISQYGWDDVSLVSLNTLYEYYYFNKNNDLELAELKKELDMLKASIDNVNLISDGGILEVEKKDIIEKSKISFKDFVYSRYSIRNFAPGEVNLDLIKEAVYIAQKTPSVCNRQSSRVYVYSNKKMQREILKYQNGNAGFGEYADKIIIITSDLRDFRGVIERNQSYIDGGLYAMSLLYALHSLGLATCPLNLSLEYKTEQKLKKVAKIEDYETLIMMIAVGNIPEKVKVASSPRRKVEDVLTVY